jgi:hypothetical protein
MVSRAALTASECESGTGKGQAASGKAEAIKVEAEKKRLEKTEAAKMAQLEHVKKNAPKELKTEVEVAPLHTPSSCGLALLPDSTTEG